MKTVTYDSRVVFKPSPDARASQLCIPVGEHSCIVASSSILRWVVKLASGNGLDNGRRADNASIRAIIYFMGKLTAVSVLARGAKKVDRTRHANACIISARGEGEGHPNKIPKLGLAKNALPCRFFLVEIIL